MTLTPEWKGWRGIALSLGGALVGVLLYIWAGSTASASDVNQRVMVDQNRLSVVETRVEHIIKEQDRQGRLMEELLREVRHLDEGKK